MSTDAANRHPTHGMAAAVDDVAAVTAEDVATGEDNTAHSTADKTVDNTADSTVESAADKTAAGDVADFADLVLNVARLIRARTAVAKDVVALTETERRVMRLVDLHPGCTPGDIAARARLQRTNVSTALSSLEAKRMVTRTSNGDRTVTVELTKLAADNLGVLRDAWSQQLGEVLGDDRAAVRQANELLTRLEARLTDVAR